MFAVLIVLGILALFYDRARRVKNSRLMNIYIGIGAFFIGLTIAGLLSDVLMLTLVESETAEIVIRPVIAIISVWFTFRALKSILNPAPKIRNNNPLDADLRSHKAKPSPPKPPERYNKNER